MNQETVKQDISELRAQLFAAITGVRNGTLDVDRARAVNDIGKTLVDTARVELDYLKITDGSESAFIAPAQKGLGNLPAGIVGRTIHRLV